MTRRRSCGLIWRTMAVQGNKKPSRFWSELRVSLKEHPWQVIAIWLFISLMGFGHLAEGLPVFEPVVSHPLYIYFHESHDIIALAIAAYGSYKYGMGVLVLGMLGFLAWHGYLFYTAFEEELPSLIRMGLSAGAAILVGFLIKAVHEAREEIGKSLASVEAGLHNLEGLYGVAMAAAESREINTLFRRAVPHIKKATGAEFASVHGLQKQTGQVLLLAQEGWNAEQARRISLFPQSGVLAEAVCSGKIVVENQPARDVGPMGSIMAGAGVKTLVAVPLFAGESVNGVLTLGRRKEAALPDETLIWLEALGHELGLYLDRMLMFEELERQRASAQGLARQLEEEKDSILQGVFQYAETAATAVEIHHAVLEGHHRRVAELALRLARQLRWEQKDIASVELAARVHDIGLFQVPMTDIGILDPLEAKKREALKVHTIVAVNQLKPLEGVYGAALAAIRSHHERWDGDGYPDGLADLAIPEAGRLLAVVEMYDLLRINFFNRAGLSHSDALKETGSLSGVALDPRMVTAFQSLFSAEKA